MSNASSESRAGAELVVVSNGAERRFPLSKPQVTIGRRPDQDIVVAETWVSRSHARIECHGDEFFLVDLGSSHGTFLNGRIAQRSLLADGDRIALGSTGGTFLIFRNPNQQARATEASHDTLSTLLTGRLAAEKPSDIQLLNLYIEGARAISAASVLKEILLNLVEISLRLTRAERGFVFLCKEDGSLELEAGRSESGVVLTEASGISHSILKEVLATSSEFIKSEGDPGLDGRESVIAQHLRSVVCIPLRKSHFRESGGQSVMGVLYLDSRVENGKLTGVSHELIRAIAREAAALVENAFLAKAEEEAHAYQRELAIASSIQQRMMEVKIPSVSFAAVEARNISCKEVGGDFYDVMRMQDCVAVVVADVSGKGISAALLASVLQGAVYPQLLQGLPLAQVAAALNEYIYNKIAGQKYATLLLMRLYENGELEYINCGHLKPLLRSGDSILYLENGNVPVGLLAEAEFTGSREQLKDGDHLLLMTDGIAEAEDKEGVGFGELAMEAALTGEFTLPRLFAALDAHRGEVPLADDCTALLLRYSRQQK
jgi:serine phosphatase RsbU (regulator of sigma subunit)